jgi:DNA-binding response OmpR family regulator
MVNSTVLIVTGDALLVDAVRRELKDLGLGGSRIDVAASIENACESLKTLRPRLILLDWPRKRPGYESIDRLLWSASKLPHGAPIVMVAARYDVEQATVCYRMGVADYISRADHLDQLAAILSAYLSSISPDVSDRADELTSTSTPGLKKKASRTSSSVLAVGSPSA